MAVDKKDIYHFILCTIRVYYFIQMDKPAHYYDTIC